MYPQELLWCSAPRGWGDHQSHWGCSLSPLQSFDPVWAANSHWACLEMLPHPRFRGIFIFLAHWIPALLSRLHCTTSNCTFQKYFLKICQRRQWYSWFTLDKADRLKPLFLISCSSSRLFLSLSTIKNQTKKTSPEKNPKPPKPPS